MSDPRAVQTPGRLVAHVLYGSWRQTPAEVDFTAEDLDAVTPQLLGSGAGALGWRRISGTTLRTSPGGLKLQQAYRLQSLYAGLHEEEIEQVTELLRAAAVVPLLIKGRAAAELYPERGLRPYGDIDLCFESGDYAKALAVLASPEAITFNVDPHDGLDQVYGLNLRDLMARSQSMKVGNLELRVPCFEDHLHILCIHFLKHGGWRPLSLCDVAAALESRPESVDWDRCLGRNKRRADWVACTIGLAHQLLGAAVEGTPVDQRAANLPRWLVPAVLKQWETPYPQSNETTELMITHLKKRRVGVINEIGKRWPNPIRATVYFRARFNELPRLPFQVLTFASQAARFLAGLPRGLGNPQR